MTNRSSIALLITLVAAPAWAAGPYQVYRVATPGAARSAPSSLVTVLTAGTVADPTLANGVDAYYFVRDGSGASLDLSMGMDRAAGSVLITFQGTGTLRDDALGSLQDLFGPAGVLATMAGQVPGSPLAATLEDARQDGLNALDDLAHGTGAFDDNAVKTWLDFCLRTLDDAADAPSPFTAQQIRDLQDRILEIARALVTYRLELAMGHCGVCNGDLGTPVCQAVRKLDDGNALRLSGGDPFRVMDAYGASINFSLQAMDACY